MANIPKTILCCDGGLFSSWAERLSREYDRVLYYRPIVEAFLHTNDYHIGDGYDSFEKVDSFWDAVNEADTIAFFWVNLGDWAVHLRRMGKAVWSPFYGENLELDRLLAKEVMEEVGLPVNDYSVVYGMKSLREFLQHHDDQWVKIPRFRGLTETFQSINYDLVMPKLNEVEFLLGGGGSVQQFICESAVKAVTETGYDGWCVDGMFPKTSVVSCEIKDCGSASIIKPYNLLPKEVRATNDKMSPILEQYSYRGFWSTEIRVTKNNFYPTDFTCRAASPCGESLQELYSNMGEVIEAAAHGEIIEPKPVAKYAAQAMIESPFAEEHWLPVTIPSDIRSCIKLYNACVVDGQEYAVPIEEEMPQIGSIIATGDSLDSAIKKVEQYASRIEGYQIKVNTEALWQAKVELGKAA